MVRSAEVKESGGVQDDSGDTGDTHASGLDMVYEEEKIEMNHAS